MYPNLLKAMEENNLNDKHLSKVLNMPYTTVRERTKGKYSFTFEQAIIIQQKFFPNEEVEYLFLPKKEGNN